MRGKNRCYACFTEHFPTFKSKFPKDFPNKFKLCCSCVSYAGDITRDGLEDTIKWIKSREYLNKFDKIRRIRKLKKINKLINLG